MEQKKEEKIIVNEVKLFSSENFEIKVFTHPMLSPLFSDPNIKREIPEHNWNDTVRGFVICYDPSKFYH
jgi:hypothetical protein